MVFQIFFKNLYLGLTFFLLVIEVAFLTLTHEIFKYRHAPFHVFLYQFSGYIVVLILYDQYLIICRTNHVLYSLKHVKNMKFQKT